MKKPLRRTNNTILIAVEGYTEDAFVKHVKSIYCRRDALVTVTIKNARGHGPEGIVDAIKSAKRTAQYNLTAAVFDGDIPIPSQVQKWLKDEKIELFISTPAIEATLLSILKSKIPRTTKECKERLLGLKCGDPTERQFYEKHFDRATLDGSRATTSRLNDLIIFMTRKK